MKKFLLISLISLSISSAYSQSENQWKFGLHASPSVKWLSTTTKGYAGGGAKIGFSYGLVAEYFFADRYSFCSGIDFAYRGGKIKDAFGTYPVDLQYLELPVTLKMHTKEMNKFTYYAKFGVAPGINLKATGNDPNTGDKVSIKSDINAFYMALKIGLGAEYEIADRTMVFAGITWNNGFIDAFQSDNLKANNNAVELEIGVLF